MGVVSPHFLQCGFAEGEHVRREPARTIPANRRILAKFLAFSPQPPSSQPPTSLYPSLYPRHGAPVRVCLSALDYSILQLIGAIAEKAGDWRLDTTIDYKPLFRAMLTPTPCLYGIRGTCHRPIFRRRRLPLLPPVIFLPRAGEHTVEKPHAALPYAVVSTLCSSQRVRA